jgi:dipeptidyl aminopeptidase B
VNDTDGYLHVALFSPADSSEPKFVTNGKWEVVGDILGMDAQGIV